MEPRNFLFASLDGGVDALRACEKAPSHRMKGFELQPPVEGVDIGVRGFFDREQFVEPDTLRFDHGFRDRLRNSDDSTADRTITVA